MAQFEAACAHVTGTRQPLTLLESLTDTAALMKARARSTACDDACLHDACTALTALLRVQVVKPSPEELACGSLADALICRVAAKDVL